MRFVVLRGIFSWSYLRKIQLRIHGRHGLHRWISERPFYKTLNGRKLQSSISMLKSHTFSYRFPDIGYFRDPEVQTQLTNVLFVYSTTHPDIGYRQGMHELLAPLYYAVDFDSIPEGASSIDDVSLKECCSRVWVAADAWALFSMVMRGVGHWYEWRETKLPVAGKTALASHVQLNVTPVDVGLKPYIAPIVEACNRIQSTLLKSVDPQLWRSLQSSGIEPQIYGM